MTITIHQSNHLMPFFFFFLFRSLQWSHADLFAASSPAGWESPMRQPLCLYTAWLCPLRSTLCPHMCLEGSCGAKPRGSGFRQLQASNLSPLHLPVPWARPIYLYQGGSQSLSRDLACPGRWRTDGCCKLHTNTFSSLCFVDARKIRPKIMVVLLPLLNNNNHHNSSTTADVGVRKHENLQPRLEPWRAAPGFVPAHVDWAPCFRLSQPLVVRKWAGSLHTHCWPHTGVLYIPVITGGLDLTLICHSD